MAITKVKTESHEEWLNLRSKYIGGSDAAAVVGLNLFSSPYSLWAEKTGRKQGFSGNLATEVGTYLEDFVAKKFATETGKRVRNANLSFLNSDYPWAIANIDREIVGEDAGLEIKTTSEMNLKKFKGGEYPENYYCQCVHYLAVTGKQRWYLAVLIGNREFRWFTIERDEAEISALMTAEKTFWEEYVGKDIPPEADGLSATSDAIKTIFAESDDTTVDLTPYGKEIQQYIEFSSQIKELEKMREEAANTIKAFMGSSGAGESGSYKVSWKTQSRRTFDSNRFADENKNVDLSEYYKNTSTRVFRVTKRKGA